MDNPKLYNRLLDACYPRFRALEKTEWNRGKPLDKLGETDRETALWLSRVGIYSVKDMILNMIGTLQFALGVEDIEDYYLGIRIDTQEASEGYWLPVLRIDATYDNPDTYEVWGGVFRHCKLPREVSRECFQALPKSEQDYLKSFDYDNLTENDEYEIYDGGNYDVWIEIDAEGKIHCRPCGRF